MAAETLKNSLSLTDNDAQTFLEGEENQCTKKKKPKVTYSVALAIAFLAAENENPQADLVVYLKDFLCQLGKSQSMIIAMHLALEMIIYFTSSLVQKLLDLHDFDCPHRESHLWDHH